MKKAKLLILIACLTATMNNTSAMKPATANPSTPHPPTNPTMALNKGDTPAGTVPTSQKTTFTTVPPKITITVTAPPNLPTKTAQPATPIPDNIHGLTNIGASCYLNSLVQILYHTNAIHQYISRTTFTRVETHNLKLLFEDMDKAAKSAVINPTVRYKGMKFHHGSDDPQYVFLDHFAHDLEKVIDFDSEMDNPVLLDGTPYVDKSTEKNKPVPEKLQNSDSKPTSDDATKATAPKKDPKESTSVMAPLLTSPPEQTPKRKKAVGCSISTCQSGGHYYAIVKSNGKWFKINDSSVSYVGDTFESVVSLVKRSKHLFRFVSYE